MSQITFGEFIKLPREEQNIRYKELSDHDKFLARINDVGLKAVDKTITDEDINALSPEAQDVLRRMQKDIDKQ